MPSKKVRPFAVTVAEADDPDFGTGNPSVPVEQWGKDHWSTFAFVETLNVDGGRTPGLVDGTDRDRMRCDENLHPGLVGYRTSMPGMTPASQYPTRLKGGVERYGHDDWSCVEDFVAMGLVRWEGTGVLPQLVLTDEGWRIAALLRQHKGAGGRFADFDPGTIALPAGA